MSENSKIEWTTHTFNIAWGCVKVSPGCKFCYADSLSSRYGFDVWGPNTPRRVFGEKHWSEPLKWNRAAEKATERARVFCSSMCDNFEDHPTITAERAKLWPLIRATPWLDWQLLTKRADRMAANLPDDWGAGYPNVWLGVSVENQYYARRIRELMDVPARVRFLSYEPALGPLELTRVWHDDQSGWLNTLDGRLTLKCTSNDGQEFWAKTEKPVKPHLDWIICGGESGRGARPMQLEWARSIVAQCKAAGVAVFFKQMGAEPMGEDADAIHSKRSTRYALGTILLADKKGGDIDEFPSDLRIREFPKVA